MPFFAYIHCKPDGTPFYVGKGTRRRAIYLGERNPHHKAIVAKYGPKAIQVALLECSEEATAFTLERGIIKCLRRAGVELANFTDGGEGGPNPSSETRKRLSAAAKKRGVSAACQEAKVLAKRGKPLSPEHREKLRMSSLGRVFTEEHKANIAISAKKRGISPDIIARARVANLGRERSLDERVRRGRSISATYRSSSRVVKVRINGVVYTTLRDAANAVGATPSGVLYALRNSGMIKNIRVERVQ
jgi:hypothetical protein